MKPWVIVANAPWTWESWSVQLVRDATGVIAADGGANHLARIGVRPVAVVGDLDSIRVGVRAWIGEDRCVLRDDQEHTDLHKAFAYLVEKLQGRSAIVLAATGGRQDHALEALGVLARWAGRGAFEMRDGSCRIVPVRRQRVFATFPEQTVSLLPWGRCEGVRTNGLHWELADEALDVTQRTGVSNRAVGSQVKVRVRAGTLLVFLHQSEPPRGATAAR